MYLSYEDCREFTDLTTEEYAEIKRIAESIDLYADLAGSDFFIDCFSSSREGLVVAHGRPKQSLYKKNIAGEKVLVKNEPTVFYTRETGVGMKEAYGISQENVMVQQRTSAIRFKPEGEGDKGQGRIIGVLIAETDVTDKARMKDKMSKMADVTEKLASEGLVASGIADIQKDVNQENILLQETHHRIKNNLQTISSILNIQRRRTDNQETKEALTDNIARINSLAQMHEILMKSPTGDVDVYTVIEDEIQLFRKIHEGTDKDIEISLEGESLTLPSEKVQAISMIVNELMVNAVKHGFKNRSEGHISVKLVPGGVVSSIIVSNDGEKFVAKKKDAGLGFDIVRGLTEDKLRGDFSIQETELGTTIIINFPM